MWQALALTVVFGMSLLPAFAMGAEKPVTDVKSLAGSWQGHAYDRVTGKRLGKQVTLTIKDDGSYQASGAFTVQGALRADGGKVFFQSSRASGTVTLHEEKGQETLKFWSEDGKPVGEYDRVK